MTLYATPKIPHLIQQLFGFRFYVFVFILITECHPNGSEIECRPASAEQQSMYMISYLNA